jgi:hypothetical protein
MTVRYHFHIQNFVQISSSQVNELLENHREISSSEKEKETVVSHDNTLAQSPKAPFMVETLENFQKGLASGLGNTFATELLLKLGHLLKIFR